MKSGLGTQLAYLLDLLDSAVQDSYVQAQLATRPRYTPVLRALSECEPSTLGQIAQAAKISQPSATQTVALMIEDGLISSTPGPGDGRQRLIRFTDKGRDLMPKLQTCWSATRLAADTLDAELAVPLSALLAKAIEALERKPFAQRIAEARQHLDSIAKAEAEAATLPLKTERRRIKV
ncbi:MAG: MarR family transcriptional regulator [Ahniella sp.]|nr:MarR family transcriptional regulator [Ahniella sp.]